MGRDTVAASLEEALQRGVPAERRGTVHCLLGRLLPGQSRAMDAREHLRQAAAEPDPAVAACGAAVSR